MQFIRNEDVFIDSNDIENEDDEEFDINTSFNPTTLENIRDVLYELNEYFDEFTIEVVTSPNFTKTPYNLNFNGLSGNVKLLEIYDSSIDENMPMQDSSSADRIISNYCNYCFTDKKPGNLLKIRAKGRKTNYNIITLIQMILHKRFSFRIGLSGVLVINGGRVLNGYVKNNCSKYHYANVNCDKDLITVGIIINDPINITENDKDLMKIMHYKFRIYSQHLFEVILKDVTPKETEYIAYFNIAEEIIRLC